MNPPARDREKQMAELLRRIDEATDANEPASELIDEDELDCLSAIQLAELLAAKDCLNALDQMRHLAQATTDQQGLETNIDGNHPASTLPTQSPERYELIRLVGQGGFAKVYLAHDPVLDRHVALKIPHENSLDSEEAVRRFEREARAAATLDHPAIIPVYEAGVDHECPYLSMAYCDGTTLAQFIKQHPDGLPDIRLAGAVVHQLARALSHAHARGIVHRDLKPGNILIDETQADLVPLEKRVRITDFGLVKVQTDDQDLTVDGAVLGTPAYMSPEQAGAAPEIGPASDQFSLGIILYQLLTGRIPHRKDSALQTLQAVAHEPPESLRKIRPQIPQDLEAITLKCLEKKPTDRYPSTFEVAEDLERWMNNQTIHARPITSTERVKRWAQNNPIVAASLTLAMVSLSLGLGVALWQWNNAAQQNRLYLEANQTAEFKSKRASDSLESLISSFAVVDPFQSKDGNFSPTTVLAKAKQDIEAKFAEDPIAKSKLLDALAKSFTGVGDFESALQCRESVFSLLAEELGEQDPKSLDALRQLAIAQFNAGNLADSLETRKRLVNLSKAHLGDGDTRTIDAMIGLGQSYREMGQIKQALDLHEKTSLLAQLADSNEGLNTKAMTNLAETYQSARLIKEATEIIYAELEEAIRIHGQDHQETMEVMTALAAALATGRKYAEATEQQEAALAIAKKAYGFDDPRTLRHRYFVAKYRFKNDPERAVTDMSDILIAAQSRLGLEHPTTIFYFKELGKLYKRSGERELAEATHKQAHHFAIKSFGPDDYRSIEILIELCKDCLKSSPRESIKYAEEAVERLELQVGPEHLLCIEAKQMLSFGYYHAGQNEPARKLTHQNLTALTSQLDGVHPKIGISIRRMIYILLEMGDFAEAEVYSQMYFDKSNRGESETRTTRVARNLLANAQLEQGKLEEAAATVAPALASKAFKSPASELALCVRGTVHLEQGNYEQSEKDLVPALRSLIEKYETLNFPHQRSMMIRYAERARRLYESTREPEQAKYWQEKVIWLKKQKDLFEKLTQDPASDGLGSN